jgi:hypothetical protein
MVLQLPPELKEHDRLTQQDLPAVDQFVVNADDPVEDEPLIERGTLMPIDPKQLPQTIVNGLSNILVPEHLKGPLALIYRPIFVAAIGLHALLLFSGGKHEEKHEVKEKEKPATITQIATGKAPKKLIKLPTTQLKPIKPVLPKLANPLAQAPAIKPKPEADKKPEDKKPDEKPEEKAAPKPETPTQPQNETPMLPGGAKKGDPFESFNIVYPGAVPEAAFYRASGANSAAVEGFFKGQSGFTAKDGTSSPTRKVIEISKDGVTRYLGVFPDGSDTVYILTGSEAEIPDNIGALKKVRALPPDYNDAFTTIGTTDAGSPSSDDFTDYALYWTAKESEGGTTKTGILTSYAYDSVTVAEATAALLDRIKPQFKDVSEAGTYGGGKLYRMTGPTGDYFLNILDSKNGGTIVVTFENDPNK